ncbi:MAG: hypothetical protein JXA66_03690 [Oligoflexia bacterium]|nr:hypothetical protein [Oligoflexia bacterium]
MRFFISTVFVLLCINMVAFAGEDPTVRKKIIYRKHTELDFSGETVQGKIRAPEIFYIFQRKRTTGHDAIEYPRDFSNHDEETGRLLKELTPE